LTSTDSNVWSHHERMLCRPKRYSSIPPFTGPELALRSDI
jgi:hypothetical protein